MSANIYTSRSYKTLREDTAQGIQFQEVIYKLRKWAGFHIYCTAMFTMAQFVQETMFYYQLTLFMAYNLAFSAVLIKPWCHKYLEKCDKSDFDRTDYYSPWHFIYLIYMTWYCLKFSRRIVKITEECQTDETNMVIQRILEIFFYII